MKNVYKLIYCILIIIIFFIVNLFVKSYFSPIFLIIVLYLIASPIYKFFHNIIASNKLASFVTLIIINLVFILSLIYLGGYIILTANKLVTNLFNNILIKSIIIKLNFNIDILWDNIRSMANPLVLKSAALTGEALITYFISNITVFFLISDKEKFVDFIKLFLSGSFIKRIKKGAENIRHILTLEIILVLFSLFQTMIGFLVLKVPDGIILSIICGLLDILPYVGTIIVFAPLIIYNILVKDYITAVGLISLYAMINILRQILEAKYIGDRFSIHPLVIVLSLYIGIQIFGLTGLLLGPLYIIITKEIIFN